MAPDLQASSSLQEVPHLAPQPLSRLCCKEDHASTSPYCEEPDVLQFVSHVRVKHVAQLFSWDCGLACTLMALQAAGIQCDYTQLRQLCPTTSIWTIDLAHLISRFGVHTSFCTITLGPNPAFVNESFYMSYIEEDEARVSRLFHDAPSAGISLSQCSLSSSELASILRQGDTLIITLVDKRKLDPWLFAAEYALCGLGGDVVGYTGHYILLNGYDPGACEFLVHDPAQQFSGTEPARIGANALDAARKAFGTDEDLLLLSHPGFARHVIRTPVAGGAAAAAGRRERAAAQGSGAGARPTGSNTSVGTSFWGGQQAVPSGLDGRPHQEPGAAGSLNRGASVARPPQQAGLSIFGWAQGSGVSSCTTTAAAGTTCSRKRAAAAKGTSSSSDSDTTTASAPATRCHTGPRAAAEGATRAGSGAGGRQAVSSWYAAWGSWGYPSMWGTQWGGSSSSSSSGSSSARAQQAQAAGVHLATPMVPPLQQPSTPTAVACGM